MTLVIDNRRPLEGFPISPHIRDYVDGLTPEEIQDRLAQEATRQGKTPLDAQAFHNALAIFLILLAGFLIAQEKDRPEKPVTDALNEFVQKYVSELPGTTDHGAEDQDGPWAKPRALRARRSYDPAALVAALESFEQGDGEEQSRTLTYLETAIDRDRPGQRRIFGRGVNPMAADEAA